MKLRFEQLLTYLQTQADGHSEAVCRVFFLSGDEPLQLMEAAQQIRQYARSCGFEEREIITLEGGKADWSPLSNASVEQSLFSQQKMLDVRLSGGQPGVNGSKAIRDYVAQMPADQFLLLQTGKLDKNASKSAWVKALEKQGVMIQVWGLSQAQTLAWVARRMREQGLQPSQDAVKLLTERIEGNLLAADQEIKKLALLYGKPGAAQPVEVDQVMQAVADSSRFTVFDLSDAILQGEVRHLHHILQVLREEDTPLPLVLWALSTLARQLHGMCEQVQNGMSETRAVQAAGFMPRSRQALFPAALRRLRTTRWSAILHDIFKLEKMSKGQAEPRIRNEARIWDEVLEVALSLAGKPLLKGVL